LGAARALGDALGVRFLAHHLYAERVLAMTRARLDDATFAVAWSSGQRMTLEEAVAETREALTPPPGERSIGSPASEGLTPRELEVLRLLIKGCPDREIAEILYISPRTVQTHIARIFDKFGVDTRVEATAVAVRRGLV
jgi:DNA-binding CsgD family transcriptional regulator